MFVGVDVGGSGIRLGLVAADGTLGEVRRVPHGEDLSADVVLARVAREVRSLAPLGEIEGVGIGIAAWVRREVDEVVGAPNLPWTHVAAATLVSHGLDGTPVRVFNDLKAIAWGEYRFGAGRNAHAMLAIYVGTGVGSAVVERGQLVLGAHGFAGEIGHLAVGPSDGPACGCGLRGCLEAYAGGRALARAGGGRTAGELDAAARSGDMTALAILEDAGARLGTAIASAVLLGDPDVLVIGGGVWDAASALQQTALRSLRERIPASRVSTLRCLAAQLGDRAGIVGAADLVRERLATR